MRNQIIKHAIVARSAKSGLYFLKCIFENPSEYMPAKSVYPIQTMDRKEFIARLSLFLHDYPNQILLLPDKTNEQETLHLIAECMYHSQHLDETRPNLPEKLLEFHDTELYIQFITGYNDLKVALQNPKNIRNDLYQMDIDTILNNYQSDPDIMYQILDVLPQSAIYQYVNIVKTETKSVPYPTFQASKQTMYHLEECFNHIAPYLKNMESTETLRTMCQHCPNYHGKDHDFIKCKNNSCFQFYLAFEYLEWYNSFSP